jgi:hypothetical protein
MKKNSEDFTKIVTELYGSEFLFEFNTSKIDDKFTVNFTEKNIPKTSDKCKKCNKLIISLIDKKTFYTNNICHKCSFKENE